MSVPVDVEDGWVEAFVGRWNWSGRRSRRRLLLPPRRERADLEMERSSHPAAAEFRGWLPAGPGRIVRWSDGSGRERPTGRSQTHRWRAVYFRRV